jgi:arsenite-transporting ATPase
MSLNSFSAAFTTALVVDTAPTGHTLRLLALPQFVDGLLGKLIKVRMKLSGIASTLQSFLGDSGARERAQTIDTALNKLDTFRRKISNMESRLKDGQKTFFVVVTVPTKLAVQESKRLVSELTTQGITVKAVVVNQCVQQAVSREALEKYYERRREAQAKWIRELANAAANVSGSQEYCANGDSKPIAISQFPFFDVELVGVPALAYVGSQEIIGNQSFDPLLQTHDGGTPKVVIVGGKGR